MILKFNTYDLKRKLDKVKFSIGKTISLLSSNNRLYLQSRNDLVSTRLDLGETTEDVKIQLTSDFLNIIKNCPEAGVDFTITDNKFMVKSGKFKCSMNAIVEGAIFDSFEDVSKDLVEFNEENLESTLKVANISAAKSASIQPLCLLGTNIKVVDQTLYIQSSDKFRVSQFTKGCSYPNFNIAIVGNIVEKCIRSLKEYKIFLGTNRVYLHDEECEYLVRNYDGVFPDVDKFIKIYSGHEIIVDKKLLLSVLDRCSIVDNDFVELTFNDKELTLYTRSDIIEVKEVIELKQNNLKGLKLGASKVFLKDAITSTKDDNVRILIEGELKPFYIMNESSSDFIHLILPVKII